MSESQAQFSLEGTGLEFAVGCVPGPLVDALRVSTAQALDAERTVFVPGDEQFGRALFAPAYGGGFLSLLEHEPVFEPLERRLGGSPIIYTMTTSVLPPGSAGAIDDYHVDLDPGLPDGLALSALIMLDEFGDHNGATEFLRRDAGAEGGERAHLVRGRPGDVVFFDPRLRHRSTTNHSDAPRRAVLFQLVRPWMKQRVDVTEFLSDLDLSGCSSAARRRLGLTSIPPGSIEEFVARRGRPPW